VRRRRGGGWRGRRAAATGLLLVSDHALNRMGLAARLMRRLQLLGRPTPLRDHTRRLHALNRFRVLSGRCGCRCGRRGRRRRRSSLLPLRFFFEATSAPQIASCHK